MSALSLILAVVTVGPPASAEPVPVTVRIGEARVVDPPPGDGPDEPPSTPSEPAPPPAPADPVPPGDGGTPEAPEAPAVDHPDAAPAPDPDPPTSPLPRTGADALRLLRDASALVAAGLLLMLATRPASAKDHP